MAGYRFITLRDEPWLIDAAADWFSSKWGVPRSAYIECMRAYLLHTTEYGWYLCLSGGEIVGGMGVIVNDFHDRPDLTPNVCAVYTEPQHRGNGVAGRLLRLVAGDMQKKGVWPLYLVTDHVGFYERYGWEFLCPVNCFGEDKPSRMYVRR